jgi:hypothetical protein
VNPHAAPFEELTSDSTRQSVSVSVSKYLEPLRFRVNEHELKAFENRTS